MNDADWTKARAALQTAMMARAAGQAANWTNADTGLKGTVTAVGQPFANEALTCNAFLATVIEASETHWYQGRACRAGGDVWEVTEVTVWTPPRRQGG